MTAAQKNFVAAVRQSMLPILAGAICTFTGCASFQSGPVFYEPVTKIDRHGNASVKMEKVLALDADIEGDRIEIKTPSTSLVVTAPVGVFTERVILNRKGDAVLGTERIPALARIGTSPVIGSKGTAFRDGVGAISTGIVAGVAASALGPATGSAGGIVKGVVK